MVKTLHFHCRGHGSDPWELRSCIMFDWLKKKNKNKCRLCSTESHHPEGDKWKRKDNMKVEV